MREILFRAKIKTDNAQYKKGDWVQGDYVRTIDGNQFMPHIYGKGEVIKNTISQYTGLTDKNGKKIFEGDICRNTKTGEIVTVAWHGTMAGYVWSKKREGCGYLYEFGELFRCYDKYEVIGNIHDNPELLKGGAE